MIAVPMAIMLNAFKDDERAAHLGIGDIARVNGHRPDVPESRKRLSPCTALTRLPAAGDGRRREVEWRCRLLLPVDGGGSVARESRTKAPLGDICDDSDLTVLQKIQGPGEGEGGY